FETGGFPGSDRFPERPERRSSIHPPTDYLAPMHGGHDHSHSHQTGNHGRIFALTTALNVALVAAQVIYGLLANSLALLADAGHNFGDVMGLVMAWAAFAIADWRPSNRFTCRLR